MTTLEYILDGLEAALELERELGVRAVECDRSLLATPAAQPAAPSRPPAALAPSRPPAAPAPVPDRGVSAAPPRSADAGTYDFVFLHHRPLPPSGVEMMAKIVLAMKRTALTAPIVVAPPLPKARTYVVLGAAALRTWFPGTAAAPGQWVKTERGDELLVTYSPEYVLRFATVTPAVRKIKADMWSSLKEVMRRYPGKEAT